MVTKIIFSSQKKKSRKLVPTGKGMGKFSAFRVHLAERRLHYSEIFGYRYIYDAHNVHIYAYDGPYTPALTNAPSLAPSPSSQAESESSAAVRLIAAEAVADEFN